ncbi:hypothetical protein HID58_039921 [Brassica napus]|uniref:Sugar phosphate transporter domain-containing protein n=1 Tax=Brassica napus TaxID=3708 RepID=A0ABQ7XHA8_BRANA|nr:hypothetical protein HID58_039921 [Brassica napus]
MFFLTQEDGKTAKPVRHCLSNSLLRSIHTISSNQNNVLLPIRFQQAVLRDEQPRHRLRPLLQPPRRHHKFAITYFNYPGLLTALQYLTSAVGVWLLGKLGFLHHDAFAWDTAQEVPPRLPRLYLAIFTNTNLLRHANVDTFIVFRSLTPLLVAVADTVFRGQPRPSRLTFLSLLVILAGALATSLTTRLLPSPLIPGPWLTSSPSPPNAYGFHSRAEHLGGWLLQQPLVPDDPPLFWFLTGEHKEVFTAVNANGGDVFEPVAFFAVALSCESHLRNCFHGDGVVNKFLTVVINVVIWDKHATLLGWFVCLLPSVEVLVISSL